MNGAPKLDGRRAKALEAELVRRAEAVLSGDGRNPPVGTIARALFGVAARIGEEVTRRLDQAPAKQADNFYTAAGIGRDPARPAVMPVGFKLVEGGDKTISAPAGTQLMAQAGGPVVFETETRIDLAPGTIAALRGLDAERDAIAIPADAVLAAKLPHQPAPARRLRSGAAAGATKVQIDPAAGLAPGMLLSIGEGDSAREYQAVAVEGDLVTIAPPLEAETAPGAAAVEVTAFAPFTETARNHQSHALYLGHSSLLDVPSAVTITVSGADLPAEAEWSWWGKLGEDDEPAWQALGPGTSFKKAAGKLVKKKIRGHESLWLRASLDGKSAASAEGRDIRIAIGGGGPCGDRSTRCVSHLDEMNVGFEAIANTTPVVTNSPFHPFGREPRLYDSFYIGSDEAFSKVGADASLCFSFAGADLGRMAAIKESDTTRIFAVGADGLLYRALLPTLVPGTTSNAELRPVPSPSKANRAVLFQKRSPLALWKTGTVEHVAVAAADKSAIYVASLDAAADLATANWLRLPLAGTAEVDALAVHGGSTIPVLYARVGADLFFWSIIADGMVPAKHGPPVRDLMQVEPSDPLTGVDAVLIVEHAIGGQLNLVRKGTAAKASITTFAAADLPEEALQAFVDPVDPTKLFIAGYDLVLPGQWELKLAEVDAAGTTLATPVLSLTGLPPGDKLPVAFSPGRPLSPSGTGPPFPKRPMLSIASKNPVHITWYRTGANVVQPALSWEPTSIGSSANLSRGFVVSDDYVAVQRPDVGLFFRRSIAGGIVRDIRISATSGFLVDANQIPSSAAKFGHFPNLASTAQGIELKYAGSPVSSGKHVLTKANAGDSSPAVGIDDIFAFNTVGSPAVIGSISPPHNLPGTGPGSGSGSVGLTLFAIVGTVPDLWHFVRSSSAPLDEWPGTTSLANQSFTILADVGRDSGWAEAVLLPSPSSLEFALAGGLEVWPAENANLAGLTTGELLKFGNQVAVAYPHAHVFNGFNGRAMFLAAPTPWQSVGPDRPPNPALSWEYWNGQSWWALATLTAGPDGLTDDTANFVQDGGVFFKVPRDIQPTDVGGRTSHWVRARLVGGDYGEAKVTVKIDPVTGDQTVTRDLGTIRAPHVISLKLGYCAKQAVPPEIVLTEDSLGAIDQTSANEAGLAFPVFMPLAELMNPVNPAEKAEAAAAEAGRCDDPCPERDDAEPSPCEAPGAYDSCDSPCVAPPGYRRPAAAAAQGFVRGLMVGFTRRFSGNTVSLYVDAEPAGPPAELIAEVLRGGRFVPINVAGDTSYGLTEPGILTLAMPDPPDQSGLFGAAAHWLRLRPRRDPGGWSPRLRGIHLNAALARSVEMRTRERLGASIGVEDQEFRLADGPVLADSLELRVREPLADEDNADGTLDVLRFPSGLPGDWVLWQVAEDLDEQEEPKRVFTLDAEQGLLRFGNGRTGRIPPLGADVLAVRYARVVGARANGVEPGTQVQLLAPLAGVERAIALDHAAGGSDVEALVSARRRAAAKVRHGRRILTRADLEEHGLTLSPAIAQVRAESRGGGMRLIVVMKEPEVRPLPAQLRAFAAMIREVAGFGLARAGGLTVVGPRLLPLAVAVELRPRTPDLFAEAAVQAEAALRALFDPATGNYDGRGWPLGRLPVAQDIAAALAPIEALALPVGVTLERADKETRAERALPAAIPSDVLVRIDPAAIAFQRSQEEAA